MIVIQNLANLLEAVQSPKMEFWDPADLVIDPRVIYQNNLPAFGRTMAKSSVSRQWFIAVDGPPEILRQKWMEYKPPSGEVTRLFVVSHSGKNGDNPHVHVLLEESEIVQKQSLDKRLHKYFETEKHDKKRGYSSKVWDGVTDGEGAGSYCFHEQGAEILVNMGISDEDVAFMRKANAQVQKVVALNKERASNKLIDKTLQHFRGKMIFQTQNEHKWMEFRYKIAEYMFDEIKQGRSYHPGEGRLKMFMDEIVLKLSDDDGSRKLAHRFVEKFYLDRDRT